MREHGLTNVGKKLDERREWVCKKCGELRNNKETHIHGRGYEPKGT